MKELTPADRRALRARAHALNPTVMIGGAGLTDTVLHEVELALKHHELIKIRMLGEDRGAREAALERICAAVSAAPVQLIGKILIIYRPMPKPEPEIKPKSKSKSKSKPKSKWKPGPPAGKPRPDRPRHGRSGNVRQRARPATRARSRRV